MSVEDWKNNMIIDSCWSKKVYGNPQIIQKVSLLLEQRSPSVPGAEVNNKYMKIQIHLHCVSLVSDLLSLKAVLTFSLLPFPAHPQT